MIAQRLRHQEQSPLQAPRTEGTKETNRQWNTTYPVMAARVAELDAIELLRGAHEPDHQFCVMEAVAWVAGVSYLIERLAELPVCDGSHA